MAKKEKVQHSNKIKSCHDFSSVPSSPTRADHNGKADARITATETAAAAVVADAALLPSEVPVVVMPAVPAV